jgi:hypothetical protein
MSGYRGNLKLAICQRIPDHQHQAMAIFTPLRHKVVIKFAALANVAEFRHALKKPRLLSFNPFSKLFGSLRLETAPNLGYVWGKWEQNVIDFKKSWYVLSFAVLWRF